MNRLLLLGPLPTRLVRSNHTMASVKEILSEKEGWMKGGEEESTPFPSSSLSVLPVFRLGAFGRLSESLNVGCLLFSGFVV